MADEPQSADKIGTEKESVCLIGYFSEKSAQTDNGESDDVVKCDDCHYRLPCRYIRKCLKADYLLDDTENKSYEQTVSDTVPLLVDHERAQASNCYRTAVRKLKDLNDRQHGRKSEHYRSFREHPRF